MKIFSIFQYFLQFYVETIKFDRVNAKNTQMNIVNRSYFGYVNLEGMLIWTNDGIGIDYLI